MKKILTIVLSLCILASMATCFAISVSAEEDAPVSVTVGQKFEWNGQSGDEASKKAWREGGGKSPDGLWRYQFYALTNNKYGNMVICPGLFYAWNTNPGETDFGYARVREYGANFHPGEKADVVKVFTCPSGGTIELDTTVTREAAVEGEATGTSIAVYLEDQLIYPEAGGGDFLSIQDAEPHNFKVTVDVSANERIYIHLGCINGEQNGDSTYMTNTVTYKAVNDESTEVSENTHTVTLRTNTIAGSLTLTENDIAGTGGASNSNSNTNTDSQGASTGLIIGIVAGAVAVVGIAVVVVIVLKKKKAE